MAGLLKEYQLWYLWPESNVCFSIFNKVTAWQVGLQWYTGVPVRRDIFCHDTNIVYWTSYRDIYDTFTNASTNMGKHCLQLVLTLLLFSPYAQWCAEQTDEKNLCWAVFSIIFEMVDTTNACMLPTRLVSCTDFWAHEQDTRQWACFVEAIPVLSCYVTYHVLYHENCIGIRIVSWKNVSLQA